MMNWSLGYNVHEQIIRMYAGLPHCFRTDASGYAQMCKFVPTKAGRLDELTGIEEFASLAGVHDWKMYKRVGDAVSDRIRRNMERHHLSEVERGFIGEGSGSSELPGGRCRRASIPAARRCVDVDAYLTMIKVAVTG